MTQSPSWQRSSSGLSLGSSASRFQLLRSAGTWARTLEGGSKLLLSASLGQGQWHYESQSANSGGSTAGVASAASLLSQQSDLQRTAIEKLSDVPN